MSELKCNSCKATTMIVDVEHRVAKCDCGQTVGIDERGFWETLTTLYPHKMEDPAMLFEYAEYKTAQWAFQDKLRVLFGDHDEVWRNAQRLKYEVELQRFIDVEVKGRCRSHWWQFWKPRTPSDVSAFEECLDA